MRRLCFTLALIGWIGVAHADDSRAEMAAALTAALDTHPAAAVLPGTTAATKVAATPAAKHVPSQANLGRAAAEHAQGHDLPAAALAHQAQAAAMAAAGQAQAAAAKQRAAQHPHPHP